MASSQGLQRTPRKPRILLAACGSVAAVKFAIICRHFSQWAEVKAVTTRAGLHFVDLKSFPWEVSLYSDHSEWSDWKKIGDPVLHIQLRKWADILVIAPLSANTLAKISGGLCDNLLTCIVRAWDYSKPMFVAPSMNTSMWKNPVTYDQLKVLDEELGVSFIPPVKKTAAGKDYGKGIMPEITDVHNTVRVFIGTKTYTD